MDRFRQTHRPSELIYKIGKRHCHNLSKVLLLEVTTLSDCHETNNYFSSNEKRM
jgi:hypothetical protein